MLEINTIAEFQQLPTNLQSEIQKALRTKDRLEEFLRSLNTKAGQSQLTEGWKPCPHCLTEQPGTCRHCAAGGQPGWLWAKEGRDSSDIHPSQINRCLKLLWYSCNGQQDQAEEYIDPRLRMIFDIGHAWHDVMQRYGRMGAWGASEHYHKEVPIDPNAVAFDGTPVLPLAHQYWIRGAADAVIDRYECRNVPGIGDVSVRMVHEYKTINSGGYSKLTRPKPEHKFQATIYAAVFNVPLVVYLYTNKDNCQTADFPLPFDTGIWNEVAQKILKVQHYTNADQEPPWEETSATKNPQECMECGYRNLCKPPMVKLTASPGRRF
jgi:CRISPR/Cas system-associated exonuclease Cas4 (RecB family)